MNLFRILADVTHAFSKGILIFAIHRNRSAEGVSFITQFLYILVFLTRYLDLLWTPPLNNLWNFMFKIFYITTSVYILALLRLYPRSRERERAWKLGGAILTGAAVLAPFITMAAKKTGAPKFSAILVVFSLVLEAFCVLPQLLLLRETRVPTVIDSYYLLALGAYRLLYIFNWIERWVSDDVNPEAVPVIFGIIQTLFYLDFAWVYYTRQRVKLRGGRVLDGDDLNKSWVLNRVLGRRSTTLDEEESPALGEDGDVDDFERSNGRGRGAWGSRGISVSADDDILAAERDGSPISADARMRDPDELMLGDDDDEDAAKVPKGIKSGEEWRERGGSS